MNKLDSIKLRQGDDFEGTIVFRDPITRLPKNLQGSTIKVECRNSIKTESIPVSIINALEGQFAYHAPSSQTKLWTAGAYDVWIVEVSADERVHSTKTTQLWVEI